MHLLGDVGGGCRGRNERGGERSHRWEEENGLYKTKEVGLRKWRRREKQERERDQEMENEGWTTGWKHSMKREKKQTHNYKRHWHSQVILSWTAMKLSNTSNQTEAVFKATWDSYVPKSKSSQCPNCQGIDWWNCIIIQYWGGTCSPFHMCKYCVHDNMKKLHQESSTISHKMTALQLQNWSRTSQATLYPEKLECLAELRVENYSYLHQMQKDAQRYMMFVLALNTMNFVLW